MVVTFSAAARARGNAKYFDEVEQGYVRVAGLRVPQADPHVLSPIAKIPVKVFVLLQVGVRRVLELVEAFVSDVNADLFAPPFVTARAALETSCLLYRIAQEVDRVLRVRDLTALPDFNTRIDRALLGGKSEEWAHPKEYEALNVLTVINQLTKDMPNLRTMYDLLSEYAHPNYSGMMGVYQRVTNEISIFVDHPAPGRADVLNTAVGMAGFALLLTGRAVTRYQEVFPAFVRLCEEQIHAGGTWPANVPYPRP